MPATAGVGLAASTSAFAPDPLGDHNVSDRDTVGALAVAEASTEFGINRAFARATSPDLNLRFPPLAGAFASSSWSDELTINTAASGGFISFGFQFHAFTIQSSYSYPSPVLTYEVKFEEIRSGNSITLYRLIMDGNGDVISYLPIYADDDFRTDAFELTGDNDDDVLRIVGLTIPFTANRPFGFNSSLGCETRAPYSDANVQTCNANGTSLWAGITSATDVNGNVLTDWTVRSASGTNYTKSLVLPAVSVVPEPGTWLMLALGMFATGGAMRRKRSYRAGPASAV